MLLNSHFGLLRKNFKLAEDARPSKKLGDHSKLNTPPTSFFPQK